MHPLINAYLESTEPPEFIMKQFYDLEPHNKMYEGLYKVSKELSHPRTGPREFVCDDYFLSEKEYDHDLVSLYYQLNSRLANVCHKFEASDLLAKRSDAFTNHNTPPHIKLIAKSGVLKGIELYQFIEDHLAKYAHTSPRYANTFGLYYQKLACSGRFTQAKLVDFYFANDIFKPDLNRMAIVYFANGIETLQLDKIKEYKQKVYSIDENIEPIPSVQDSLLWIYKLLYQVLYERDQWPPSHFEKNKNILALYYLLNRQIEKALQIAKEFSYFDVSRLASHALLRCELVNKNFESAHHVISKYIETEADDYLLYFFYARIEIANGNRELAAKYFNQSLQLCRKYKAEGVFDFEISLSYELSVSDLRFLLDNCDKTEVEIIPMEIPLSVKPSKIGGQSAGPIGISNEIKMKIHSYAQSDLPILITGETGVGKDFLAKLLHDKSNRKDHEFYAINCGAISETLLQSELFGHVAGSFTGANKTHKGVFEAVGKGTILLDEIGEISPTLQVALLRVLDQNEYKPVGSSIAKKCQCRILFATNANLEKLVEENKFRKDLLFRLKRLEIAIPPLRDHPQDIPELIMHYLSIGRSDLKSPIVSPDLLQAFQNYSWPGNIRQLKNEMEKLRVLHSEKLHYTLDDYPFKGLTERKRKERTTNIYRNRPDTSIAIILNKSNHSIRRLSRYKDLFKTHKVFTQKELIEITKASPKTVASDLDKLCEEGFIIRKMPTPSPRTHFFEYNQNAPN